MSRITNARQGLVVDQLKFLGDVFVRVVDAESDATARISLIGHGSRPVVTDMTLNLNVLTNADVVAELSAGRRFALTVSLVPMDDTENGLPVVDSQVPTATASTVCVARPVSTDTPAPSA